MSASTRKSSLSKSCPPRRGSEERGRRRHTDGGLKAMGNPAANPAQRLESMLRIRRFEEQVVNLSKAGAFRGHYHVYIGQEATAVTLCENLTRQDMIFTTWRNHGHLLARGASPQRMLAEILGRAGGYAGGKSGTLHLAVKELGMP